MAAQDTKSKSNTFLVASTFRKPVLIVILAVFALFSGFVVAAWLDGAAPIRAEGSESQSDEWNEERKAQLSAIDPEVWPVLDHIFPQEVDLLSPEPLVTPVRSLGPARVDSIVLAAVLKEAAVAPPLQNGDAQEPTNPDVLPDQDEQAPSPGSQEVRTSAPAGAELGQGPDEKTEQHKATRYY
jgi:hypothetical protein